MAVLFVPQTPRCELAPSLRVYERKRGALRRFKVEMAGISLKQKLFLATLGLRMAVIGRIVSLVNLEQCV